MTDALVQSTAPAEFKEIPPTDTETPAFGPITRFTVFDLPKHPWVVEKLTAFWPHITRNTVSGWINSYSNANQAMFIKTDGAVGMAVVEHETPNPKPFVREVFVFLLDEKNDAPGIALYREFIRWAKTLGATDFRGIGGGSDIKLSKLKAVLKPEEYRALAIPLDIPKK